VLIYVIDAAELKLCLLLRSFFADEGNRYGHWIGSSRRFRFTRARVSKRKEGPRSPSS
jgi:hypothetical protein